MSTDSSSNGPPSRGPRVLVTGASGFIGSPCVDLLVERGWSVQAVSRQPRQDSRGEVTWHAADLLDPRSIQPLVDAARPTHLLHLAWATGREGFRDSKENYRWVSPSLELLRAFAEGGGQRAVFTGTGAEYDWSQGTCSEGETPLRPSLTYGLAKRATSELFAKLVEQSGGGLSGAWARLFFLFGPGEDSYRLIASIVAKLLRGEAADCTHDRLRRDYLFVEDAAGALVELLASDLEGEINIASGEAPTLGELVREAAELVGREDLVRLGGQAPPTGAAPLVVADIDRLRDELGWSPRRERREALRQTIDWWREQADQEREQP